MRIVTLHLRGGPSDGEMSWVIPDSWGLCAPGSAERIVQKQSGSSVQHVYVGHWDDTATECYLEYLGSERLPVRVDPA